MAKILHQLTNTSGDTRRATAYGPGGPGGEVITSNGTSGNSRVFSFYANREDITGSGTTNSLFSIGNHGADTETPIPEGLFVAADSSTAIGIDTTPYAKVGQGSFDANQ